MSESFPGDFEKPEDDDKDKHEAQRLFDFLEDETATTLRFTGDVHDPTVRRMLEVIRSKGFNVVIPEDN